MHILFLCPSLHLIKEMYYFQVQQVWLSSLSTEELRSCFPFRCKSVFFINLSKFKYLNFRSRILCWLLLPPIPADNLQSWPWLPPPPHAAAKEGKTKEKEEVVQYFLSQTKKYQRMKRMYQRMRIVMNFLIIPYHVRFFYE